MIERDVMTIQYTKIKVSIKTQTDKAVLIENDGGEWWVPWSCVEDNGENFDDDYEGPMYVAQWFLDEKEIEA